MIESLQSEAEEGRQRRASDDPQGSLFQLELVKFIDISHPLAVLAGQIDGDAFEKSFGASFCEDNGAPGKPVRLMAGLHYLKHTFNLSDELRWSTGRKTPTGNISAA